MSGGAMWQRAKFLEPTIDPDPFWVKAEPPTEGELPTLNAAADGFESEKVKAMWYKTNVLAPSGTFCMWAPQDSVELFAEFTDDAEPDRRFVKVGAQK